ncbi:replication initiation protein [Photobacterium carnosum]|uniref:replication initiation protein n=1 Tax=Photobacterium carnosum TaxID=2023717 RepID=UPI001E538935
MTNGNGGVLDSMINSSCNDLDNFIEVESSDKIMDINNSDPFLYKGVPSDSSFKMPDELRYIIPSRFLYGRQELKKNQRKIVALLLLQVKQWRDKLYEEDMLNGKKVALKLPESERNKHFNDYIPDPSLLPNKTVIVKFQKDITNKMFGDHTNDVNKAIRRALTAIMGRVVHEEDIDHKGRKVLKMYTIIPRAILIDGEIEMSIDHDAVKRLMNHSFGYSDTDLDIWSNLDSGYAQKLLEVVSKNKIRADKLTMSIADFKFTFGCDFKTYTKNEILALGDPNLKVGDYKYIIDEKSKKLTKIPMYPRFSTFKERVIKPAFSELLQKSQGHWKATDEDALGYRLIRTNLSFTHIEFCLKYIKNPKQKIMTDTNNKSEYLVLLEPLEKIILEVHNVKKIIDVTQERVNHWKMVINMYILHVETINKSNSELKYHNDSVDAAIIRFRELFAKK